MKRIMLLAAVAFIAAPFAVGNPAEAGERRHAKDDGVFTPHKKSRHYRRRAPRVKGSRRRVGGYSYSLEDSFTYNFRIRSQASPFDSGFFFDSGISSPTGNVPYLNSAPYLN